MKRKDMKKTGQSSGYPSGVKSSSMGSTASTSPNSGLGTTNKGRNSIKSPRNCIDSGGQLGSGKRS